MRSNTISGTDANFPPRALHGAGLLFATGVPMVAAAAVFELFLCKAKGEGVSRVSKTFFSRDRGVLASADEVSSEFLSRRLPVAREAALPSGVVQASGRLWVACR